MAHPNLSVRPHAPSAEAVARAGRLRDCAVEPLPRRNPGETFRKTPATVGKPKPVPGGAK